MLPNQQRRVCVVQSAETCLCYRNIGKKKKPAPEAPKEETQESIESQAIESSEAPVQSPMEDPVKTEPSVETEEIEVEVEEIEVEVDEDENKEG